MNSPLRFRPYLRPMVWGGRRLAEVLGKALPTPEPYGEAWEISDHASHHSVVASEPARRHPARPDAARARRPCWASRAGRRSPGW